MAFARRLVAVPGNNFLGRFSEILSTARCLFGFKRWSILKVMGLSLGRLKTRSGFSPEAEIWASRLIIILIPVAVLVALLFLVLFTSRAVRPLTVDMSWPNCSRLPTDQFSRAIIGVNGGLDFKPNPCLGQEVRQANTSYALYVNTGDPGFPRIREVGSGPLNCAHKNQLNCYSFNYGYQAALYSMRQADLAAAYVPGWWLDVESINSWTTSLVANRADLMGMIYGFSSRRFLTPKLGIYTASNQWASLVGKWPINLPLWLGTGDTSSFQAAKSCDTKSFLGGPLIMTQYTIGTLDFDYPCQLLSQFPAN